MPETQKRFSKYLEVAHRSDLRTAADFSTTNGRNGEQEKIRNQGRRQKVHWEFSAHPKFGFAILVSIGCLLGWRDSKGSEDVFEAIPKRARHKYRNTKRKQNNDICMTAQVRDELIRCVSVLTSDDEDDEGND